MSNLQAGMGIVALTSHLKLYRTFCIKYDAAGTKYKYWESYSYQSNVVNMLPKSALSVEKLPFVII